MNKALVFLRQVFFPFPAAQVTIKKTVEEEGYNIGIYSPEYVGVAAESADEEVKPVLDPRLDVVARIIGLLLALYGSVNIAGLSISDWLLIVCQ